MERKARKFARQVNAVNKWKLYFSFEMNFNPHNKYQIVIIGSARCGCYCFLIMDHIAGILIWKNLKLKWITVKKLDKKNYIRLLVGNVNW